MMSTPALNITTPGDREIVITREFNAPRQLAWAAMTRPEYLKKWLFGPPGWEFAVCEGEPRAGELFRWVWRGPEGAEMTMRGTYLEVTPPERIVRTECFEFGCESQAGEQHATMVLADLPGNRTLLTLTLRFPSKEARDGAIASGVEHGLSAGYARLDGLFAAGA